MSAKTFLRWFLIIASAIFLVWLAGQVDDVVTWQPTDQVEQSNP